MAHYSSNDYFDGLRAAQDGLSLVNDMFGEFARSADETNRRMLETSRRGVETMKRANKFEKKQLKSMKRMANSISRVASCIAEGFVGFVKKLNPVRLVKKIFEKVSRRAPRRTASARTK